jgi:hypothetical protein
MARRNNEPIAVGDKAKIRVFFAEVEGNNESVQEALKTMLSAMSRPVRVISEQKGNGDVGVLPLQVDAEVVEEVFDQADSAGPAAEEAVPPNARKPRGTGKKTDRNSGLSLVPDLNFMPNGQRAFKQFLDEKHPKTDLELALATVYYMQHVMALPKIGPAHVMTAFKEAGKAIPVDLRQTIRNVKSSKIWLNFSDIENIRTTTQGDNFVEHEMVKATTS